MTDLAQKIAQIKTSEDAWLMCNQLYASTDILEYVGGVITHLLTHRLSPEKNSRHREWAKHDFEHLNSLVKVLFKNAPTFAPELRNLIEAYNQKTSELLPKPLGPENWLIEIS